MALTYQYSDKYLGGRVDEATEDLAIADVALLGTFPADSVERLVIIRAYILTCLKHSAADTDAFAVKLGQYQKEWGSALNFAKAAQAAAQTDPSKRPSFFSIPIERA